MGTKLHSTKHLAAPNQAASGRNGSTASPALNGAAGPMALVGVKTKSSTQHRAKRSLTRFIGAATGVYPNSQAAIAAIRAERDAWHE